MPKAHHEIATDPTQIVYSRGPWERRAASRREREREKYTRSFIYRAVPFTWIFPGRGRATPLSRCHREKNKKIRRPKKNLRRSMGIISVTNWPHHRLSLSVCVCMLAESPAQPTDQPSFLFHWTRSRFFPYFIFSSSSFWFAPLSEWALSSSPNSPTTIPHRPALFFFFHVWLRFSSCDVRILN
jgi:hypothetical protein